MTTTLDLMAVFRGAPIIYSVLLLLSITACALWLYTSLTFKMATVVPKDFLEEMRQKLLTGQSDAALEACRAEKHLAAAVIGSGISMQRHGPQMVRDAMQSEGKRYGASLWQRISLLNDIAMIAPMLGLLGTVLGIFYAFYDVHRSAESLTSIFDGLGVAVGTTVAGLIVAILAMTFHTLLTHRTARLLNAAESELLSIGALIDSPAYVK